MKTSIHIAASLDGFIADANNGIHWLESLSTNPKVYSRILPFIAEVDGVVMGRKTYEQVLTFGEWSYAGKHCLVVTSSVDVPSTPMTHFIRPDAIMDRSMSLAIQRLWVVGGGDLNGYMVERGWVDELIVTVAPILLGNGKGLMASLGSHVRLHLLEMHDLADGFVELTYGLKP